MPLQVGSLNRSLCIISNKVECHTDAATPHTNTLPTSCDSSNKEYVLQFIKMVVSFG